MSRKFASLDNMINNKSQSPKKLTYIVTLTASISAFPIFSAPVDAQQVLIGVAVSGISYGESSKFIVGGEDVTSSGYNEMLFNAWPPDQKRSWLYSQDRIRQFIVAPRVSFISRRPDNQSALTVGFGFNGYKRLSNSKILFNVVTVTTEGRRANPEFLPASGTCTFSELNTKNPTAVCNALSGGKKYSAIFRTDVNKAPTWVNMNSRPDSRQKKDFSHEIWRMFVTGATSFIDS